jgi:hypothetical protein
MNGPSDLRLWIMEVDRRGVERGDDVWKGVNGGRVVVRVGPWRNGWRL